jgi:dihydroorotase
MQATLIKGATVVNEGKLLQQDVLIQGNKIVALYSGDSRPTLPSNCNIINAEGLHLLPGVIDDQVHFREPGMTHKGDIYSESKAAVAGGITSFMEMPNTNPQTITQQLLTEKYELGAHNSLANYSFYIGATNDNLDELLKTDPKNVCGIKIFMGSSTGNMLVDKRETLEAIFKESVLPIAVHCEDEETIKRNTEKYRTLYNEDVPIKCHAEIRDAEACYKSSALAVELANKYNTRLHILHLSSAKEMSLLQTGIPLKEKRITAEVCVHHLWFNNTDYDRLGTFIKWNPSIKTEDDRKGLWEALLNGKIDVIATDHAPHTLSEKQNTYFKAPSGGPLVQHSLPAMIEFFKQGKITLEQIVYKMCHAPADIFNVDKRGYIREGYYADLVLVNLNKPNTVNKNNILYKCGWSPFEGVSFSSMVTHTFVNGHIVYNNGIFDESARGMRLLFNR